MDSWKDGFDFDRLQMYYRNRGWLANEISSWKRASIIPEQECPIGISW